jgi:tRNA1(Val) A37 N6-methylase TrmN6
MTTTLLRGKLKLVEGGPLPPEDALWLAASVDNVPDGARVLDAGCGVGIVGLALALRYPSIVVDGLDVDDTLVPLAARNALENGLPYRAYVGDVLADDAAGPYDVIVCNPPFYDEGTHTPATEAAVRLAHHLPLGQFVPWLDALKRRLGREGALYMILHTQFEPDIISWAIQRGGRLELTALVTSPSRAAKRMLVCWKPFGGNEVVRHAALTAYDVALRDAVLAEGKGLREAGM